tara:strand:- start:242 stop:439 length:198 start_codon:yes stop_codon:yes gene_type:complete
MINMDALGVKHYLLEYKDKNMEDFQSQFGFVRLRDLNREQLHGFFVLATRKDMEKILFVGHNQYQ